MQVGAAIAEDVPLFLTGVYILLWYLYHFVEDMAKACLEYNKVDIDKVEWVNKLRQRLKIKKVSIHWQSIQVAFQLSMLSHAYCAACGER